MESKINKKENSTKSKTSLVNSAIRKNSEKKQQLKQDIESSQSVIKKGLASLFSKKRKRSF